MNDNNKVNIPSVDKMFEITMDQTSNVAFRILGNDQYDCASRR